MVESQLLGGMVWGMSFALHELAILDQEDDAHVSAFGIRGVREIGITGTCGAIANAIWHATGKRIRRFPLGRADLLD